MRTSFLLFAVMAIDLSCPPLGHAQFAPIIDGTVDAIYGEPLSTQNTNTQFGDAVGGDPIGGTGSEIDRVFATVTNGRLYVVMAGNLDAAFMKLEVFIDSGPGGVASIDASALPGGVDAFCCGGFMPPDGSNLFNDGALQRMDGLAFDAGFTADHYLTFQHGMLTALSPALAFYAASADYADLRNGTAGRVGALGAQFSYRGLPQTVGSSTIPLPDLAQGDLIDRIYAFGPGGAIDETGAGAIERQLEFVLPPVPGTSNAAGHRNMENVVGLQMAIDNGNGGGVSDQPPYTTPTTEDLSDVVTGIEFSIPLSEIGDPQGDIRLMLFVNGSGHDYASNQFSGDGILVGNPGDLSGVDLNDFAGDQFVIVPEPLGGVLAGGLVLVALARRRVRTAPPTRPAGPPRASRPCRPSGGGSA
ncbi:MAG: hypothetical protein R3F35_20660 [Myxococcota bacterium]